MSRVVTRRSSRRYFASSNGRARCMVGAVVPDDEIADAPGVTVDELRLGRGLHQIAEEQPSLRGGPVDDPRLVRRQIERAPERAREGSDDERMDRALQVVLLVGRELEPENQVHSLMRLGRPGAASQALSSRPASEFAGVASGFPFSTT